MSLDWKKISILSPKLFPILKPNKKQSILSPVIFPFYEIDTNLDKNNAILPIPQLLKV